MDCFEGRFGKFCLGDARELIKGLPSNSVDAVITDPPYKSGYEAFFSMIPEFFRVCRESCWLAFYWPTAKLDVPFNYGITKYFNYRECVVILLKHGTRYSLLGRKNTLLALIFSKGNPSLRYRPGDLVFADEDPEICVENPRLADWRPTLPTKLLIYAFTGEGDTVLDPMAGYGSIPLICETHNRRWVAFEVDRERYEAAKTLILNRRLPRG